MAAPPPARDCGLFVAPAADVDLSGEWSGWRVRGNVLIAPNGDRITRERLDGILITEHLRRWATKNSGHQGLVVSFERECREKLTDSATDGPAKRKRSP